ncbi:MAG: hypothetical protein V7K48_01885 [Nostoc sp.]
MAQPDAGGLANAVLSAQAAARTSRARLIAKLLTIQNSRIQTF